MYISPYANLSSHVSTGGGFANIRVKIHVLHANTLPRALPERREAAIVLVCRVEPPFRSESRRFQEDGLVVEHIGMAYADGGLCGA